MNQSAVLELRLDSVESLLYLVKPSCQLAHRLSEFTYGTSEFDDRHEEGARHGFICGVVGQT
jgi:hypothetical protein